MNIEKLPQYKWEDETDARKKSINRFLISYFSIPLKERVNKYNSFSDFHFSGGSPDEFRMIINGELEIEKINALHKNGEIEKIKVTIGRMEIFIADQALDDYLKEESLATNSGMLENEYQEYLNLGGIINKKDYQSALDRMKDAPDKRKPSIRASMRQAVEIANYSRIKLNNSENGLDPKVVLYVILRKDIKPEGVKYHHGQMSDQQIFGEVLRMLGDAESLDKLIKTYPNISFEYEKGK